MTRKDTGVPYGMGHIVREESEARLRLSTNKNFATCSQNLSVLIRDESQRLINIRNLEESDIIVLLTPAVPPISQSPSDASDPFEPLERSLSNRHPWISHISYNERDGITENHIGLIKEGHAIILCFAPKRGEDIPVQIARTLYSVGENKPIAIVVCCKPLDPRRDIPFPTVIQTFGYSPAALEATTVLIFGEDPSGSAISLYLNAPIDTRVPRNWPVEQWDKTRDTASLMTLWRECVSPPFFIKPDTFIKLLERPQYNKNFVVRHPISGDSLGFCATFLLPADREGKNHVACMALILVRSLYRDEGIGISLYSQAIEELKRAQNIIRIQLGSSFPKILYGPPQKMASHHDWFRRRGWQFHGRLPGQGRYVYDLVLDFRNWSYVRPLESIFLFQESTSEDIRIIQDLLESNSFDPYIKLGWYDQYMKILKGPRIDDIILAIEDKVVVGAAITYNPWLDGEIQNDLPWAGTIGSSVGGVTCMYLPDDRTVATKAEIRNGLLDIVVFKLKNQKLGNLYFDAVVEGVGDLKQLGFQEWAQYKEVWKDLIN